MRDIKRIPEVVTRLQKVWEKHPDLRLGQLILNIEGQCNTPIYYLEDDELINKIERFYSECFFCKGEEQ